MLLISGEDTVLFMFFLTEVDFFFPNAEVDLEQDQRQTELLSGSDTDREIIQYRKKERKKTHPVDGLQCQICYPA